jgi:anti-sigma factor RsiW
MSTHLATKRLSAYLDDELDGRSSRLVERHVSDCPHCRRRLRGLSSVVVELKRMPAAASPPPMLDRAIERELVALRRRREGLSRSTVRSGFEVLQGLIQLSSMMAVAVAMVAILVAHGMSRDAGPARPASAPSTTAAPGAGRAEAGGRRFVFDRGAWWQEDLLAAGRAATPEVVALSASSVEEALARAPWVVPLLRRGPVVLELDGQAVKVELAVAPWSVQRAAPTATTR